jgi:hypothetical protein
MLSPRITIPSYLSKFNDIFILRNFKIMQFKVLILNNSQLQMQIYSMPSYFTWHTTYGINSKT